MHQTDQHHDSQWRHNPRDEPFSSFPSLISVTIPSSVTNIEVAALSGIPNVSAIIVDPANPSYSSVDGVLFNKSQTTLIQFPPGQSWNLLHDPQQRHQHRGLGVLWLLPT